MAVKSIISWDAPKGAVRYEISYRIGGGNVVTTTSLINQIEIPNSDQGIADISVTAINPFGVKSPTLTQTGTTQLSASQPMDVTGFSIANNGATSYLSWNSVINDADLTHYTIRFSPNTVGASWNNSSVLVPKVSAPATSCVVPTAVGTYFIKAVDSIGLESANAASVVTNISQLDGINIVDTINEHTSFSGLKTNCSVYNGKLAINSNEPLSAWATLTSITNMAYGITGIAASALYEFASPFDLGGVFTSKVTPDIYSYPLNTLGGALSSYLTMSSMATMSGTFVTDVGLGLEISTSQDNVTWSAWSPCVIGDYTARSFKFRLNLYSYDVADTPLVERLGVIIDMPDRVYGQNDILCTVAGMGVVYAPAFKVAPSVAIAAQGLQTGDYYVISAKSNTGFSIQFFNSANVAVQRTFDYVAKGYGYKV